MAYEKRLCILKQLKNGFTADGGPLSGAVYAERMNGELILTPRIAGIAPVQNGRYALAVRVGTSDYCLELKGNTALRVPSSPSLEGGFAALLCFVRSAGNAEPVAYGYCGKASPLYEPLLAVFKAAEKPPVFPPMPNSPFEQPTPVNPQIPRAPIPVLPGEIPEEEEESASSAGGYDDEAIAEADYFSERLSECDDHPNASEPEAVTPLRLVRGGLTYYNEVRDRLTAAMKKYPRDERLRAVFPQSEWVRTDTALLGIIYAEGVPRYLCVAVESETTPPEALKDACVFVPKSYFDDGEGFFIVFQDAETGEYVKTYAT